MAIHSFGADLSVEFTSGFVSVGCIHDISGPNLSVTSTDSSCLSTEWKTFIPGLGDGGEVTFTIDYSEANYNALHTILRAIKSWRITMPDTETQDFEGFIMNLGLTIPFDDRIVVPVTVKVTGLPSNFA